MTLSISCPDCGRQFSNIKPELAGKKVRCSCGASLRLPLSTTERKSNPSKRSQAPQATPRTGIPKSPQVIDAFELHYSDLEDILARPGTSEQDFDPTQPSRQRSSPAGVNPPPARKLELRQPVPIKPIPIAPPASRWPNARTILADAGPSEPDGGNAASPNAIADKAFINSSNRVAFFVILAMISAMVGFGFAMFAMSVKLTDMDFVWSERAHETLRMIYTGQFGLQEETASSLKLGFLITGWLVFSVAILLFLLSAFQLLSAGMQLFANLPVLRWGDGVMATITFVLVFLLIGSLFLHNLHTQNLIRHVNQVSIARDGDEPANIQSLRSQYQTDADRFKWGVAEISIAPGIIFLCSILRLLNRPKEES